MALTDKEIAQRLLKKNAGVTETNYPLEVRGILEEAIPTYNLVTPDAIWSEAGDIPTTPPTLTDGGELGVVKYYEKLQLVVTDAGTEVAFKSPLGELEKAIDGRFGFGYNFKIYGDGGTTQIFKGDWLVDPEAGIITFYEPGLAEATVNSSTPPYITFYKYIGDVGLVSSGATSGINVKDPVSLTTTEELSGTSYSSSLSGFTTLPVEVDGVSGITFTEGDRILVKNQTDSIENGIYIVFGTTLIRAVDHDGQPIGEVGVNDYVFTTAGVTNIATSWVLSSTDGDDPDKINVGVDTQNWSLFAQSREYEADELGLKLVDGTFGIDLNEVGAFGSGLEQNTQGIRIQETILTEISGNTESISVLESQIITLTGDTSSLESALSIEISTTGSEVTSLESQIVTLTGDTISLETALSTEISTLTTGVTSLDTALSTEISTTNSDVTSLESALSTISGDTLDITSILGEGEVLGLSGGELTGFTYNTDITSLEVAIATNTGSTASLETALSTEISATNSDVSSLETALISATGDTSSLEIVLSTLTGDTLSLESEIITLTGDTASLESALSTEISTTGSEVTSLEVFIDNIEPLSEGNAGSGLTYITDSTTPTLNVNVDDYTIKIVNDELRTPETWMEQDYTTTISGGTSGPTNIVLDYDPVGYIAAYINGVEYLVSLSPGTSGTNMPFYFDSIPGIGSSLYFDAGEAGFDIISGVDLIVVKYSFIDLA